MKLSLADGSVHPYLRQGIDPKTVYSALRACGFSCMDYGIPLSSLGNDCIEQARKLKALMEQVEITIAQAHCPLSNPFLSPQGDKKPLEYLANTLRFCAEADIPHVVIHPGCRTDNTREEFFESNVALYRSLIPYAEETGVTVLVENVGNYFDSYFFYNGQDLRQLLDEVNHPLVAACWDIGHANHFDRKHANPYDSITALGDKLLAIHAHDNVGFFTDAARQKRMDLHTMPYFSIFAGVNWDAVLQALKDIHYRGTFNFEARIPAASFQRPPFVYHGEVVNKLAMPPLSVWKTVNTGLYEMGKFMLETYEMYEE